MCNCDFRLNWDWDTTVLLPCAWSWREELRERRGAVGVKLKALLPDRNLSGRLGTEDPVTSPLQVKHSEIQNRCHSKHHFQIKANQTESR